MWLLGHWFLKTRVFQRPSWGLSAPEAPEDVAIIQQFKITGIEDENFFNGEINVHQLTKYKSLISAILSWLAHPFLIWLAFSVSRTLLLE